MTWLLYDVYVVGRCTIPAVVVVECGPLAV
jgi:hypothetical protein